MIRPLLLSSLLASVALAQGQAPNVVLILADDMGYGDVHALQPESKLATPNLDRLAAQGMTFTDAHSPSAVCTPTRYGLLTGTYCWRSRLKSGVLGGYSTPLLDAGQATLGSLFQGSGYRTGAVGKWHLGMQLPKLSEEANTAAWAGDPGIDFAGVITDGPLQHGFDSYFGVSASLDMAPYVYVRNDHFAAQPTEQQAAQPFPAFVRKGPRSIDFRIENVLDDLAREAVTFIEGAAAEDAPFFLYMPLTAPHKPTIPHEHFRGRSGLGDYGDFVQQVDWTIGRVLKALDQNKLTENTLVIMTSDNGSYMHLVESTKREHVSASGVQAYHADQHRPNGNWRGTKADIYEAGHRVPFFVRWPGQVKAGSSCAQTVCQVDLFATFAELLGTEVPEGAAQDSHSLLPLWRGSADAVRGAPVVHHSVNGTFALRDGPWKAIFCSGSGGREKPRGKPFDAVRLFNLQADPGEAQDVAAANPEVVARLTKTLAEIRGAD
jgi:arylsulfatase A